MGAVFYKGIITVNGSTGNQTISGIVDENGASFTPKAIILWTGYQTAAGFSDGLFQGFGMTDATRVIARSTVSKDNVTPSAVRRIASSTSLFLIQDSTPTTILDGSLVSVGSGQFVINWTTVPGTGILIHYVAIGGSSVTADLQVGQDYPATVSDQTHTTKMWDALLILPSTQPGVGGSNFSNPSGFGWVARDLTSTLATGAYDGISANASNPSSTGSCQLTARVSITQGSPTGTLYNDAGFNWQGFWFAHGGSGIYYQLLNLSGVAAKAGSNSAPTSNGTQAVTGLGFTPKCLLMFSTSKAASITSSVERRQSFGAADASRQGWSFHGDNDGKNPTETVGGHSATNIVVTATPNATGASTTVTSEASLQSLDSDGFTLNWTTTDATAREYMYLALGEVPAGTSSTGGAFPYVG